jgi:hypothetical protein
MEESRRNGSKRVVKLCVGIKELARRPCGYREERDEKIQDL